MDEVAQRRAGRRGTVPAIIAGLAAIAGSVAAQPPAEAVKEALQTPALARVAAPPAGATVQPGLGGAQPSPRIGIPPQSPLFGEVTNQVRRAVADLPPAGLPAMIASGVNLFDGELVSAKGEHGSLTDLFGFRGDPPRVLVNRSGVSYAASGDDVFAAVGYRFALENGALILTLIAGSIDTGQVLDPVRMTFPPEGGTRTASLPGGGQITVTIGGAHPLTPADQTAFDAGYDGLVAAARRAEFENAQLLISGN